MRNFKQKSVFFLFLCLYLTPKTSNAQLMELGGYAGISSYYGDLLLYKPSSLTIGFQQASGTVGITYKYWWDYQNKLRVDIGAMLLKYTNQIESNVHKTPDYNSIVEINLLWEHSFFKSTPYLYDPIMPYVFGGISLFKYDDIYQLRERLGSPINGFIQYEKSAELSLGIPLGIGIRSKLHRDITLSVDWKFVYTFTDDLDWSNPDNKVSYYRDVLEYGENRSNDWYSTITFSLTYLFGVPGCNCEPAYKKLNN